MNLHVDVRDVESDRSAKVGQGEEHEDGILEQGKVHHFLVRVVRFAAARNASAHCQLVRLGHRISLFRNAENGTREVLRIQSA